MVGIGRLNGRPSRRGLAHRPAALSTPFRLKTILIQQCPGSHRLQRNFIRAQHATRKAKAHSGGRTNGNRMLAGRRTFTPNFPQIVVSFLHQCGVVGRALKAMSQRPSRGRASRANDDPRQLPNLPRHGAHRDIAIGIRDGSRGLPLDGVEDARRNACLHADCP